MRPRRSGEIFPVGKARRKGLGLRSSYHPVVSPICFRFGIRSPYASLVVGLTGAGQYSMGR
jgi:hypothetical protein